MSGRAELGAVGQLQAEMLHLDLIDGADGYRGDKESSKASAVVGAPPPATKDPAAPVTMDTYRPKRPTTLNLFPIVPRTQVKTKLILCTHTHMLAQFVSDDRILMQKAGGVEGNVSVRKIYFAVCFTACLGSIPRHKYDI